MTDGWRLGANLATLANALLGAGAILYTLAGNKLWAMFLIVVAIGFDGLDGLLSRRSSKPPALFGRIADSVADAITFGLAPGFLVAVHTADTSTWHPWIPLATALGAAYVAAAVARLTYFAARAHDRPHFVGVPSPLSALAIVVVVLLHDTPALQGVAPFGVLVGTAVVSAMMVVPVPYPKIRRGSAFRPVATATAVLAALALVPLQFRPAPGTALYELADLAAFGFLVGVASYYLLGPLSVARRRPAPP